LPPPPPGGPAGFQLVPVAQSPLGTFQWKSTAMELAGTANSVSRVVRIFIRGCKSGNEGMTVCCITNPEIWTTLNQMKYRFVP
jgi:hypothetical protein